MLHTFAIYVDNAPGVLNRVASLFRRRAFNIESLTVGHTETAGVSRMTVVVDADEYGARRLEAHLSKLVPVRRVDNLTMAPSIARDLALIKVSAAGEARTHVMQLVDVFRARVVDVSPESLVIDPSRKRAYAHLWKGATVAIDIPSRAIVATWPNGCSGSRGIDIDEKRGFVFVGPTTMHALMEATGIVDTHLVDSHRRGSSGVWPRD